jgi:hypothetical protein
LRLLTVKCFKEPLGGAKRVPLLMVMVRIHPFKAADAVPEENET